jgi:hypothetical protein
MLLLALVAAPLLSHDAEAQWFTRRDNRGQNGHQEDRGKGRDKDRDRGNHEQKGEHHGKNDERPTTTGASVSGTVYNDVDNSTSRGVGEAGLSGWTVELTGVTTVTTTTDGNGAYSFAGVTAGSYMVCIVTPFGWAQTSLPRCWTTDVTAASSTVKVTGFDFGVMLLSAGGAV